MNPKNAPRYVPTAWILKWEFVEKTPKDFMNEYEIKKPKKSVGRPKGWKPRRVNLEIDMEELTRLTAEQFPWEFPARFESKPVVDPGTHFVETENAEDPSRN